MRRPWIERENKALRDYGLTREQFETARTAYKAAGIDLSYILRRG
jgi:hypothetical protein